MIYDPNVSIFATARDTSKPEIVKASEVIERIRSGKYRRLIEQLNNLPRDSQQQRDFKSTRLNGIVWQGEFSTRNDKGCLNHSGLVALDLDHMMPDDLAFWRRQICTSKYTFACFLSPRRDGLKVILRIPPSIEDHRKYLSGIEYQYRQNVEKFYDHFDDLSRLCFVSYDPDVYYNPECLTFTETAPVKVYKTSDITTSGIADDVVGSFNKLTIWADRTDRYEDHNKHCFLFRLFCACNRVGVPCDEATRLAYATYQSRPGCQSVDYANYAKISDYVYRRYKDEFGARKFTDKSPDVYYEPDDIEMPEEELRFPIDVFPRDIQQFIRELQAALNFNPDFVAVAIMFAMATLNGNKFKLRVKNGWEAPTIFWFAVVGDPGTMKTPPVAEIIKPLTHIDKQSKLMADLEFAELERQAADESKRKNQKPLKKPKFKQILINDITLESIHEIHAFNKRGLGYYKDELVGFINSMNQYRKGSDEQFWLESFNNRSYTVNRVTKDTSIVEDTNINIIGTIQPSVLSKVASESQGTGLTDRFLFTRAETNIYPMTTNDIDTAWLEWWRNVLIAANQQLQYIDSEDVELVEMDEDARARLIEIDGEVCAMQQSDSTSDSMKGYLSKRKTYLPRFVLLMNIMDRIMYGTMENANIDHVERANRIMTYFVESAKKINSEASFAAEIKNIIATMKALSKRDQVVALIEKGFKQKDIARAVDVDKGYVSRIHNSLKR